MAITFILNDENVNRYGYRVLTSGIDLTNFLKNPIALFMHQRATWTLPIGKWTNVRKEGSKLLADIEFDEQDEFAMDIKRKVEQDIFNACSMGFDPKETSSLGIMDGQTLETVTKCELLEASIVDIPGNGNAVKLDFHLAEGKDIDNLIPKLKNLNHFNMKNLISILALTLTATESDIEAKVQGLVDENKNLKAELDKLKLDKDAAEKESLIAPHIANGNLKAEQKASLLTMDTEALKTFLGNMPKKTLSGQVNQGGSDDPRANWDFKTWSAKDADGLLRMKNGTHELYSKEDYERLFKAQYQK